MRPEFTICVTNDQTAIDAASRLRYEVFFVENGDTRWSNHDLRMFSDPFDEPGRSQHIIARDGSGMIVGASRLVLRRDGAFTADELYRFDLVAAMFQTLNADVIEHTCLSDRTVVRANWRGKGVGRQLVQAARKLGQDFGMKFFITAIGSHNCEFRAYFERLGAREYGADARAYGYDADVVVLHLDEEHA